MYQPLSNKSPINVKGLIQSIIQTASQSGCQRPRGFHFQIVIRIQFTFIRTDSEKPSQSDMAVLNALNPACVSQWDLCHTQRV